jgi:hypothetical protein
VVVVVVVEEEEEEEEEEEGRGCMNIRSHQMPRRHAMTPAQVQRQPQLLNDVLYCDALQQQQAHNTTVGHRARGNAESGEHRRALPEMTHTRRMQRCAASCPTAQSRSHNHARGVVMSSGKVALVARDDEKTRTPRQRYMTDDFRPENEKAHSCPRMHAEHVYKPSTETHSSVSGRISGAAPC